ncbi:flagellar hook assembly protein FlgD [Candidatus Solirubrobacter pratensis]|jgi:flagellar basal-body rod modification protein FlgD|uniref:flagellar hook assembly protein FlgD n=1 Tax=Candidatus Solirubrobacter pratensis TaxID=1298857 RepID=UPI000414D71B|nr:flagellar hook capping FlgD N-terminal domain-containing protein [Candidatus Solirubrobacter pratensis]
MSAIPSASAADAPRQSGSTNVQNEKAMLDKDGFLKMLVAQMTQQDPSSPMDAAQQTEQMASFTMVEQITNMAADNAKTASIGMIGHDVTYTDPADKTKTTTKSGTVEAVALGKDGTYTLTVSGTTGIDPTSITQVA